MKLKKIASLLLAGAMMVSGSALAFESFCSPVKSMT